ncbi:glycoside hydrolase family 43 protein [Arthrobacter oryzae]|uniref:glycoside hydrolase family 43 protein n=1 Tax=Arthrobacter oryzae TaxID=409290 RepID=UPI00273CD059|nr:glycoside hydrolase family 43 protein [Arthrobacter oryzae]WLQ05689.1 glycoside hydrolase family 43 protein [Arthrobacter oryzae]
MTEHPAGYLFAYFTSATEADGEQVRFALSAGRNPLEWKALNGGRPVLHSSVGEQGVRDPFLLRAAGLPRETARFYLLATDLCIARRNPATAWEDCIREGSRSIVIWESTDLVSWAGPRLVKVAPPDAGNAWAPEAAYDAASGTYLLYWASTLQPRSADPAARAYHRIFCSNTTDFRTFTPARVWIDRGWSVIDSTVVEADGHFYRFSKDELSADSSSPDAKFITAERSNSLDSAHYSVIATGIGKNGLVHGEGPIIIRGPGPDSWFLFIDEFGLRRYTAFTCDSLASATWTPVAAVMPPGASHGSMLALTAEEYTQLERLADR